MNEIPSWIASWPHVIHEARSFKRVDSAGVSSDVWIVADKAGKAFVYRKSNMVAERALARKSILDALCASQPRWFPTDFETQVDRSALLTKYRWIEVEDRQVLSLAGSLDVVKDLHSVRSSTRVNSSYLNLETTNLGVIPNVFSNVGYAVAVLDDLNANELKSRILNNYGRLTHGDAKSDNLLSSKFGPILIDWDKCNSLCPSADILIAIFTSDCSIAGKVQMLSDWGQYNGVEGAPTVHECILVLPALFTLYDFIKADVSPARKQYFNSWVYPRWCDWIGVVRCILPGGIL